MPRETIDIGAALGATATSLVWQNPDISAFATIPASLTTGNSAAGIIYLNIETTSSASFSTFRLFTSDIDLSSAWEQQDDAITIQIPGSELVLPGPANSIWGSARDSATPYVIQYLQPLINPIRSISSDILAFITAYNALSDADKAKTKLVLFDGVTDSRILAAALVKGTGSSRLSVLYPGRIRATALVKGTGSSRLQVDQADASRLSARSLVTGTGTLRGLSVEAPEDSRIRSALLLRGLGSSELLVVPPVRQEWDVAIRSSDPEWGIVTALEITHPDAAAPLRVVDATEEMEIESSRYIPLRFEAQLAADDDSRAPRVEISMDNVGREATRWIDAAGGAQGAQCRIMQLPGHEDGEVEWEMTLDALSLSSDDDRLVLRLGFENGIGQPAVSRRHDPQTTPGIF